MRPNNPGLGGARGDNGDSITPALTRALDLLGKVVAPTTLLIALLFYYGWLRTNALFLYFGVSQSVLGLSVQDYLLRGFSNVTFAALRWILILALAAIWAHIGIGRLMEGERSLMSRRFLIWLARMLLGLGLLLVLGSEAALRFDPDQRIEYLYYPLIWTPGVGLTIYGLYLWRRLRQAGARSDQTQAQSGATGAPAIPKLLRQVSWGLIVAILLMGVFWIVADFADWVGTWQAEQFARGLTNYPSVIVYSQEPLGIQAPGVEGHEVSDIPSAYRYRYTGLKFLIRSNDKYFLLPASWSRAQPITIILPDNDTIRIEVSPGGLPAP